MPLDIGFTLPEGGHERRLQFQHDAVYWYLHPWFQRVREATGKSVDLYGDAEFHDAAGLSVLEKAMAEARTAAQAQPPQWPVHMGTQYRPQRQELYENVRRVDVLQALDRLQALMQEARVRGQALVLLGD